MLEMKASCESCGGSVEPMSSNVFVCSYECTWCEDCAGNKFDFVCPNCGGELVRRPRRNPGET